jgi:hypothetical protein
MSELGLPVTILAQIVSAYKQNLGKPELGLNSTSMLKYRVLLDVLYVKPHQPSQEG